MRKNHVIALACSAAALSLGLLAPTAAFASGRPEGPPVATSGTGSLGTAWTLKSQHDDDGPGGTQVAGEEFEINSPPGQIWDVTFTDNGVVTFMTSQTSTATGVRVLHPSPNLPGTQTLGAHAVNETTGETIDGSVTLPPVPSGGHGGGRPVSQG